MKANTTGLSPILSNQRAEPPRGTLLHDLSVHWWKKNNFLIRFGSNCRNFSTDKNNSNRYNLMIGSNCWFFDKPKVPQQLELQQSKRRITSSGITFLTSDVLGPDRNVDVEQLLDGQGEALLAAHHRDVVQAVEVGQGLKQCQAVN